MSMFYRMVASMSLGKTGAVLFSLAATTKVTIEISPMQSTSFSHQEPCSKQTLSTMGTEARSSYGEMRRRSDMGRSASAEEKTEEMVVLPKFLQKESSSLGDRL